MEKQDLTNYSNQELSLWVFNDETLYNDRNKPYLFEMLDALFIYTQEQKQELLNDLELDKQEISEVG